MDIKKPGKFLSSECSSAYWLFNYSFQIWRCWSHLFWRECWKLILFQYSPVSGKRVNSPGSLPPDQFTTERLADNIFCTGFSWGQSVTCPLDTVNRFTSGQTRGSTRNMMRDDPVSGVERELKWIELFNIRRKALFKILTWEGRKFRSNIVVVLYE